VCLLSSLSIPLFFFFFSPIFLPFLSVSFSCLPFLSVCFFSSFFFQSSNPKNRQRGTSPLFFSHTVVGHGSELRQVGAFGRRLFEFSRRKGERKAGDKKSSSSPARASRGRRRPTMPFKTAPFGSFFNEQWMKRHHFGQNMSFHLKGKGGKILSKSKSIFNLKFIQSSPKLQF